MAAPTLIRSAIVAGALAVGLPFAGAGMAAAQDRAPTVPESIVEGMQVSDPLAFQATAAAWNTFFIRASELALERSAGEDERALAQELVDEHVALVPALASAAEADELPTAPVVGLDGRQSGMMGRLEAAPDAEFDRLYLDMLLTGYDEAYGLFSGYAENGTGNLRAFAAEAAAVLDGRRATLTTLIDATEPS